VFGISFTELLVVLVVGLIVLGPQKLPGLFRSLGQWINQLRHLSSQVRVQSGIDEILRAEGLQGGLSELRGMMRSDLRPGTFAASEALTPPQQALDPYLPSFEYDIARERPVEGPDSYDSIADDLVDTKHANEPTAE
jgi:sec-independent protein translocase protein TatB